MPKPIGILAIHGMGSDDPDFAGLERRLVDRLPSHVRADIKFRKVSYHSAMQPGQDAIWRRMTARPLGWQWLRRKFLFDFSDAATYQHQPVVPNSVYQQVHHIVRGVVDDLRNALGSDTAPVVIIAHSLGAQVMSSYIWDAQRGRGIWQGGAPTNFQKLGTLAYMFTVGCNIPLFVSGLQLIEAIDRPNQGFRWFNYYDKDDVLGWPLKPLSTGFPNSYDTIVDQDIAINVGSWLTRWNPVSHGQYWSSRSFLEPISRHIADLHARP